MAANGTKFIRVHGRVVPVRAGAAKGKIPKKSASGTQTPKKGQAVSKMSSKQYSKWKDGELAASNYGRGSGAQAKRDAKNSKIATHVGVGLAGIGLAFGAHRVAGLGVALGVAGHVSGKLAKRDGRRAKVANQWRKANGTSA
jgi:hypothetical protein